MITRTPSVSIEDCAPPLTPKLAPWMQRLLASPSTIGALVQRYGSPLHITTTSEFERNAVDLLSPLKEFGLKGNLYFARKANKLPWFVSAASAAGLGVDTASISELRETVQLGVSSDRVIATAVGKDEKLVSECIKSGCLIVVDNDDELSLIASLARAANKTCRIGLRFSGFKLQERQVFSRFGFPLESVDALIDVLAAAPQLKLELLHAHIDRYDPEERSAAGHQLIALCDRFRAHGHEVSGIDLGGGILMRYLDSELQWKEFLDELVNAVRGDRRSFTFLNDGFGYIKAGEELFGKPDLYPVWNAISKERFVSAILRYPVNNIPLHRALSERNLSIFFEPGRALLDNTGLTAASVTFRKRDTAGNLLIGLGMNRTNLRPFRAEFCSDPLLPATEKREVMNEGAYFVGNLCSETDLIFRRKIVVDHLPLAGDTVCFANSSGYLAHHMEIGTHGDPLPKNVLIDTNNWEVEDVV